MPSRISEQFPELNYHNDSKIGQKKLFLIEFETASASSKKVFERASHFEGLCRPMNEIPSTCAVLHTVGYSVFDSNFHRLKCNHSNERGLLLYALPSI